MVCSWREDAISKQCQASLTEVMGIVTGAQNGAVLEEDVRDCKMLEIRVGVHLPAKRSLYCE